MEKERLKKCVFRRFLIETVSDAMLCGRVFHSRHMWPTEIAPGIPREVRCNR